MDDFGNVIYLDIQKTGSSFVSSVLAEILPVDRRVFKKHNRMERRPDPEDVVLTTVRNPVSQWVSLYQFGVAKRGPVRKSIESFGADSILYDGSLNDFQLWLSFCLDCNNAKTLPGNYAEGAPHLIGYQTFRYLRLNLAVRPRRMRHFKKKENLTRFVLDNLEGAHVLRTENLREDLAYAAKTVLASVLPDPEQAAKIIMTHPVRNVSTERSFGPDDLPFETVQLIWDREWLLRVLFPHFSESGETEKCSQ